MNEYPLDRERFGINKDHPGNPRPILYQIDEQTGCWNVISHAPNQDGYFKVGIGGKTMLIHRLVYQQENNCFIRPEDIVRHKCDNPHCINPDHLEIGSNYDNIQDRNKRGRTAKNENHGRAKLTNEQVIEIYHMSGSQQSIADKYGVSQRLVSLIKRKEIHTDILKNE